MTAVRKKNDRKSPIIPADRKMSEDTGTRGRGKGESAAGQPSGPCSGTSERVKSKVDAGGGRFRPMMLAAAGIVMEPPTPSGVLKKSGGSGIFNRSAGGSRIGGRVA